MLEIITETGFNECNFVIIVNILLYYTASVFILSY